MSTEDNEPPDERHLAVRRRDNEQCQNCFRGIAEARRLEVHQIVPSDHGGSEKLSNYITLCPECREGARSGRATQGRN